MRMSKQHLGCVFVLFALVALVGCGPKPTPEDPNGNTGTKAEKPIVKKEALEEFKKGIALVESNPAQALKHFEDAVDEDEQFGEAWYNLGLVYEEQGKKDKAKEAYEAAIKTRPAFADSYVNLGVLLLEQGQRDKAKELFIKVVNDENGVDNFHVQGNLNLGMIYRLEGEELLHAANEGAELKMSKGQVVERDYQVPEEAKILFAEAVRHVRKALAGDSNNIISYENLAAVYYNLNNLEVATLVCEQAIQKQKERNEELKKSLEEGKITQQEYDSKVINDEMMAPVYNTYGLVWLARGEVALAYVNFKQAMALRSNFTEAMLNVAGVAVNVQDYQTAYEIYTNILKNEPENREAELSLAVAARGLGQLDVAEKTYNDLLQKDPEYSPAKYNLAVLYQEYHRDLDKAKKLFEEFLAMPTAKAQVPVRVEEAQARVAQIEEIWAAQKAAEAEQLKIQKEMEELQRLQDEQNKAQEAPEDGAAGATPEGDPAEGSTPPEGQ